MSWYVCCGLYVLAYVLWNVCSGMYVEVCTRMSWYVCCGMYIRMLWYIVL